MEKEINSIREKFSEDLGRVVTSKDLEELKVRYLGKKGSVSALMISLKDAEDAQKPILGKSINLLKNEIALAIHELMEKINSAELDQKLQKEKIDVTLPGKRRRLGRLHPVSQMLYKVVDVLIDMGFSVQLGPDVDSDFYNFEALNFPKDHPARDMQDTFYITHDLLLRTQTSNVQVRVMEKNPLPIRMVAPGRCFRNETVSARSHIFFHQIEGIYIDKNVTFADLLATLDELWRRLFEKEIKTRYRPSYFPFVEPGIEADILCTQCHGGGCRLCKFSGWLEVIGAGMIHPEVLKAGGIDPEQYQGYAFGLGIERLTLLRYGISDIRRFTENDNRFLAQF
ncbi:MAG: phenylalanine--tRNA ligase subunit alpha [Parachlamydiales bacterium]|nr:phenylalanine--tRNA ligase subunit alpha [Parachlamydiales bacterium]